MTGSKSLSKEMESPLKNGKSSFEKAPFDWFIYSYYKSYQSYISFILDPNELEDRTPSKLLMPSSGGELFKKPSIVPT